MVFGVGEGDGESAGGIVVDGGERAAVEIAAATRSAEGERDFAVELGFVGHGLDGLFLFGFCRERFHDDGRPLGHGAGDEGVEGGALGRSERGQAGGSELVGVAALRRVGVAALRFPVGGKNFLAAKNSSHYTTRAAACCVAC